ncbi:alkaline phytoceramidase [Drepanopeziza brunnea f. sp. 'multigermtubi' MB_m1]|uniref:Alkaline phytoceramidase n=1 Tax=Marssonina brunnea f. sp. multigermtubi (strain MB_m1) TaxID=1072389 RepID=K1XJP5_MARBU|nr:alkaline phytoceramidase [Drepanopeziza brunnea f. sp. 'multigermtubi' MB_m1]EKD20913.1 alkaline phytoceramidase [Drepanopeziza brunnea f. sp. 'multigermtubi' MB_m1]
MVFSWAYPAHAHQGHWGLVDSQHNFCEEDYILTPYIAELINTLTNLTYLLYAYHGIKNNANRKDAVLRNLSYLGIAAVGLGSAVFHATMKSWTQWYRAGGHRPGYIHDPLHRIQVFSERGEMGYGSWPGSMKTSTGRLIGGRTGVPLETKDQGSDARDDLSMLVAVATVLHRVCTFDKSLSTTVISGVAITAGMTAFSAWHCITDETVMHSVLFAIMIVLVGQKTRMVITQRVSDPAVAKEVRKLALWGGIIFISGFGIWNIDNAICSSLTRWKRAIGMPWSFVLELHGWWHIFTGAGAYIFIALVEYLTSEKAGQALGSRFAWPVNLIVNGQAGSKASSQDDGATTTSSSTKKKAHEKNGGAPATTGTSAEVSTTDVKTNGGAGKMKTAVKTNGAAKKGL